MLRVAVADGFGFRDLVVSGFAGLWALGFGV